MCFHLFVNPYCRSNSVALQPSNISHRNYRVRRESCRLNTLRKCLKMREINEENPIPPKIFRVKYPIPPKIFKVKYPIPPKFCMSWSYHTPSLILWLSDISDDFLSLILFAVKAEYFIDETCILKIHDMWRHHFERFQLFVVEREYLHDADHLGAGIIAAEACHFYQVELVVVEACFLHLII